MLAVVAGRIGWWNNRGRWHIGWWRLLSRCNHNWRHWWHWCWLSRCAGPQHVDPAFEHLRSVVVLILNCPLLLSCQLLQFCDLQLASLRCVVVLTSHSSFFLHGQIPDSACCLLIASQVIGQHLQPTTRYGGSTIGIRRNGWQW